jgi:hypothetical protein
MTLSAIGLKEVIYNTVLDNGFISATASFPSTPMEMTPSPLGSHFNLAGQAMSFRDGREAYISSLGNDTLSLAPSASDIINGYTGDPLLFFGSSGSDIGTWDGFTLTLPVHSSFSFVLTNDFGGITQFVAVEGQLVLVIIPEPESIILFGLGVFGLVSYSWRANAAVKATRLTSRRQLVSACVDPLYLRPT